MGFRRLQFREARALAYNALEWLVL
ncbi:MAG: hypothetical protein JWN51_176, partial [Phycisphaerales bacterium]|nr:hypothetical protein [Phycisphaerales bacterium]